MYDDKDHIKVVILGESDVGKTALINRFINNSFDEYAKHSSPAIFTQKKISPFILYKIAIDAYLYFYCSHLIQPFIEIAIKTKIID